MVGLVVSCGYGRRLDALEVELGGVQQALQAERAALQEQRILVQEALARLQEAEAETTEALAALGASSQGTRSDVLAMAEELKRTRRRLQQLSSWLDERTTTLERRSGLARPAPPGSTTAGRSGEAPLDEIDRLANDIREELSGGQPRVALQLADSALLIHGDRARATKLRLLRAEALLALGSHNRVIEEVYGFLEGRENTLEAASARLLLARALVARGDTRSARAVLQELTKLHPGTDPAESASAMLKELGAPSDIEAEP